MGLPPGSCPGVLQNRVVWRDVQIAAEATLRPPSGAWSQPPWLEAAPSYFERVDVYGVLLWDHGRR